MSGERYLAKFIDATPRNVIDDKYTYSLKYFRSAGRGLFRWCAVLTAVYNLVPRWEIWVRN